MIFEIDKNDEISNKKCQATEHVMSFWHHESLYSQMRNSMRGNSVKIKFRYQRDLEAIKICIINE